VVIIKEKEMFTRTVNFRELKQIGRRVGACEVCGKNVTRSKTFTMTESPFNKNEDGSVCTSSQIYDKLDKKVEEWKNEPLAHAKCI
jgi:hypothetical protein